ncbi:hypothetical protein [Viscerimonas tarda]
MHGENLVHGTTHCRGVWHTPDTRTGETRKCFIIACILIVVCRAYAIRPYEWYEK